MHTAVIEQVFKVLLVEDNSGDARLVRELLRDTSGDSFEVTWVGQLSEAVARLADEAFDIILLDLSLPDASGLETLTRMNNAAPHLPIIVLTGYGDETLGVQALGEGAQDYLLKQDLDSFLLKRMLHYAIERKRVAQVQWANEERFQALVQHSTDVITILAADGTILYESPSLEKVMGYRPEAVQGLKIADLVHPDDFPMMLDGMTTIRDQPATLFSDEVRLRHADGSWRTLETTMTNLLDHPAIRGIVVNSRDITGHKQTEEAIHFQAQLLNTVGRSIVATNLENKTIYWNRFAEALYGWSAAEALGRNIEDLTPTDISPGQAEEIMSLLRAGETWHGEFTVQRKDGTPFPVLVTDSPIRDEKGTLMGMISVSMDITERKRAEEITRESEERFRAIFEHSSLGKTLTAPNGSLLKVNQAFADLLGYSIEELQTIDFASITHPLDKAKSQECVRCLLAGEQNQYRMEKRYLHKNGKVIWTDVSTSLLRDAAGSPLYFITGVADISERKQAEDEVHVLNAALEGRVLERTAQLETANKELEAFAYSVSHDLRSPLRAIDGFSRILLRDYQALLPEDGQRRLQLVRTNAQQMGRLIDDLLTFSRLSRQLPIKRPVDLAELVRQVLEELSEERENRQVEIIIADLPTCEADPTLLKQVFVNLLSNALKFTRQREAARIEVGYQTMEGERVYFVKDNGAGFDMRYADKLFGVFQRLHRADEYEGTGVGLAIVQRIIHRHSGRVWAEAEVDKGAAFYFTLGVEEPHDRE